MITGRTMTIFSKPFIPILVIVNQRWMCVCAKLIEARTVTYCVIRATLMVLLITVNFLFGRLLKHGLLGRFLKQSNAGQQGRFRVLLPRVLELLKVDLNTG